MGGKVRALSLSLKPGSVMSREILLEKRPRIKIPGPGDREDSEVSCSAVGRRCREPSGSVVATAAAELGGALSGCSYPRRTAAGLVASAIGCSTPNVCGASSCLPGK